MTVLAGLALLACYLVGLRYVARLAVRPLASEVYRASIYVDVRRWR